MKFVSLVVTAILLSLGASAQEAGSAAEKEPVIKTEKKTRKQKAKLSDKKGLAPKEAHVITLTDEKAYQAKSSFEQILLRRIEVDAEVSARARQQGKE